MTSQPAAAPAPLMRVVRNGKAGGAFAETTLEDFVAAGQELDVTTAVAVYRNPSRAQLDELAKAWELHPVLFEDIVVARQRPKVERYGDVMFVVARAAHYVDRTEEVKFSEFHVIVKGRSVAVLCQDGRWLDARGSEDFPNLEQTLLPDSGRLDHGPEAVVYRILDAIVDGFMPVLRGVLIDKEQIEGQVFTGDAEVAQRIYRLSQEVIDTQHLVGSLHEVLDDLRAGFTKYHVPDDLQTYLDDVEDHLTLAERHVTDLRDSLAQILNVNATLVAQRQNEDMKKISAWAAILFAPTLIGAIYGMNFDVMPELHWKWGYPMSLVLMVMVGVGLYVFFRKSKWM